MNCKHWMNSQEAALSLGIAVGTPRRWGKAGKLHTVQTAGHLARQLERLRVAANERGYQVRVEVLDPPERIAPTPELLAGILTLVTVLSGKLYASRAPANPRCKASVIGARVQQKSGKKDELPVKCSRHLRRRMREKDWKRLSPTLVLRGKGAALRFPQAKEVRAARVVERKLDQHLVTGRPAPTPQWHRGWREKRPSKPAPPQLAVRGESPARGTPRSRLAGQARRASPPENAVGLQIFGEKSVLYLLCYSIQNL
jgi:hypothetical protein